MKSKDALRWLRKVGFRVSYNNMQNERWSIMCFTHAGEWAGTVHAKTLVKVVKKAQILFQGLEGEVRTVNNSDN